MENPESGPDPVGGAGPPVGDPSENLGIRQFTRPARAVKGGKFGGEMGLIDEEA